MDFDLELFKMGFVIQYKRRQGDFFGELIYKEQIKHGFTEEDAQYTHCEISGGDQHAIYAKPPRAEIVDIRQAHSEQEFRILRPKEYLADQYDRKRLKIAYMSAAMNHEPYDFLGVLKFKIPFLFSVTKAKFCSEHCAIAIRTQFPLFFGSLTNDKFMPAHFGDLEHMEVITVGKIPKWSPDGKNSQDREV